MTSRSRIILSSGEAVAGAAMAAAGQSLQKRFTHSLNSSQPLHSFTLYSSRSSFPGGGGEAQACYYGRLDRMILNPDGSKIVPTMLTTRPTKNVPFEVPFSFVMGPSQLDKLFLCDSIEDILRNVISLESSSIQSRLRLIQEKKLDHVLMIFSSTSLPCHVATLDGIYQLLCSSHQETAKRFHRMLPKLNEFVGCENFHKRIIQFSDYWNQWSIIRSCMWIGNEHEIPCQCNYYNFDKFCQEFDLIEKQLEYERNLNPNHELIQSFERELLVITRKLMFILLSCNEYFGMDGFTYDVNGNCVGEEFLAINAPINISENQEDSIFCVYLSEIDRFQLSNLSP